jgi:hypothetical protein
MRKPSLKLKRPQLGRKGSSGSTPTIKPPKFLADLYADLRDRRLLPLVALLLVAIIAAPILLAGGEDEETAVAPPAPAGASASAAQTSFTVVPAQEGQLRDYRKRLNHRTARNPFKQPVPAAKTSGEDCGCGSAGGGSTAEPTSGSEGAVEYTPSEPPVVEATVKANIGFEALLKTQFIGEEPKERRVEAQTKLPNEEAPAVVYTGISPDKKGGLFLMTSNVTAFYGHGQCVLGGATCQQLKLKLGKSATFAIGFGETRYKVTLLGFVPIVKEAKVVRGG